MELLERIGPFTLNRSPEDGRVYVLDIRRKAGQQIVATRLSLRAARAWATNAAEGQ